MRRDQSRIWLAGILVAVAGMLVYLLAVNPLMDHVRLGLDLRGGFQVELQAVETDRAEISEETMETARQVILRRIDGLGVAEPTVRLRGTDRIVVELPEVGDPEEAMAVIGRTAMLELRGPRGEIIITGAHLNQAFFDFDTLAGGGVGNPIVRFRLNAEGAELFAEATRRLVGQPITILLDGEVISSPTVEVPITGGEGRITGLGGREAAEDLAIVLSSGALPVDLEAVRSVFISPLLGADAVEQSQNAALLAVAAILAFMFIFYRIPGFWANVALTVYIVGVVGILASLGAVLTLPGVVGLILSIGMAVDANVIIFERIKEEATRGKTMRSAIRAGFQHAIRAIIDANVTTLFIAGVLYWFFQTGPLRGFAVTLSIGIVVSMLTAILVTRYLLTLFVQAKFTDDVRALFGVRGREEALS